MFCTKCGTKNEKGDKVCKNCGAKLHPGKSDSITIDTSFFTKLDLNGKLLLSGFIVTVLSSFLPWINIRTPDLSSLTMMAGGGGGFQAKSLSLWNLGAFGGLVIIFYFAPLAFIGYILYKELKKKEKVPAYIYSTALAFLSLLTFSLNLYFFLGIWQFQSLMGTILKVSGTGGMMENPISVGSGLFLGLIGCSLIFYSLLASVKEKFS